VGFPLCPWWLNAVYDSRILLTTRNTKEIPQRAQGMPAKYEILLMKILSEMELI